MGKVKKLRVILWENKLSQKWLARETGIPIAHVSYYMNDKFVFNDVQKAKIAAAVGLPAKEIFPDA